MSLAGLSAVAIELTSRCDKQVRCAFCGHQDPKINPGLQLGDMDFELLESIAARLPPGIEVAFHRDGDPLAYPRLKDALDLFREHPTVLVTHGETLADRAREIIGRATAVVVSVFQKDPGELCQVNSLRRFLALKGEKPPMVAVKIVGRLDAGREETYRKLGVRILRRCLHSARGSVAYRLAEPPVPEGLVCLDMLHRPSIDWQGNVHICTRLDPERKGFLGNLRAASLDEIWLGTKRRAWLGKHLAGKRDEVPLCSNCAYWGVPTSP